MPLYLAIVISCGFYATMMDVNSDSFWWGKMSGENYVRLLTSCIQGFHVKNSHWEQTMLPQIKEKKRENGFDQGRGSRSKLKKKERKHVRKQRIQRKQLDSRGKCKSWRIKVKPGDKGIKNTEVRLPSCVTTAPSWISQSVASLLQFCVSATRRALRTQKTPTFLELGKGLTKPW